jgi:hypothetical protein
VNQEEKKSPGQTTPHSPPEKGLYNSAEVSEENKRS